MSGYWSWEKLLFKGRRVMNAQGLTSIFKYVR